MVEAEPVKEEQQHEPELQKVDDAWLSSSDSNQWDQPLQLPTTDKAEEEPVTVEKEQAVIPPPTQTIEQEISVDFSSLSLQENVPETT